MQLFEEQMKARCENDAKTFADSLDALANSVLGRANMHSMHAFETAMEKILQYFHAKRQAIPSEVVEADEQLEYLLRPHGIMRRGVALKGDWYRHAVGPMLAVTADDEIVALMPKKMGGYCYIDSAGHAIPVTQRNAAQLGNAAVCFYRPLPMRALKTKDLLLFIAGTLDVGDILFLSMTTLIMTLIGMLTPHLNKLLFEALIPNANEMLLIPMAFMLVSVSVARMLVSVSSAFAVSRIGTKVNLYMSAATMARVLSLPSTYFKQHDSNAVYGQLSNMTSLCTSFVNVIFTTGFTSIFSLLYLFQIFSYAPSLAVPALCVIVLTLLWTIGSIVLQIPVKQKWLEHAKQTGGITVDMLNGISKIKLAGAQKRMFAKWADCYVRLIPRSRWYVKAAATLTEAISLFGSVVIFAAAGLSHTTISDYMAFSSAFGLVAGSFMTLSTIGNTLGSIKPHLDIVLPLLEATPETGETKKRVQELTGAIEISNLSFGYDDRMVLDQLNLKIPAGQYIAIVGKTGCGKSTLLRLLLGFETPQKGAIYYDDCDLCAFDMKYLRQQIGVVAQNELLFSGDILSNITICAPHSTIDDAWKSAEAACIADDIRAMPMGMYTFLSEGGGGISGGQRQRLMIARAICANPKLLILDEATSALDNITQKTIMKHLRRMNITRIVVAHRLSTIQNCDRIVVLDNGQIVQDGTYEALIAQPGLFAELVERQLLHPVQAGV